MCTNIQEGAVIMEAFLAFTLFGSIKEYDTSEAERISRQEEAFVPFKLPPLQEQESLPLCQQQSDPIGIRDRRMWEMQGEYPQEKIA